MVPDDIDEGTDVDNDDVDVVIGVVGREEESAKEVELALFL